MRESGGMIRSAAAVSTLGATVLLMRGSISVTRDTDMEFIPQKTVKFTYFCKIIR